GPFLGRPRTGTFRLADLIGLDIMEDIAWNIYHRCPHDSQRGVLELSASMRYLREHGRLGSKTGGGYYQREGQEYLVLDFQTLAYRPKQIPNLPSLSELNELPLIERVANALEKGDEVGEFLREYFIPALRYAMDIAQEIAYSVQDIDQVMKWGWGWELGPFEWIDALSFERLEKGGEFFTVRKRPEENLLKTHAPFYRNGKALNLESLQHEETSRDERYQTISQCLPIKQEKKWQVRRVKDNVFTFQWNTKLNVIDADIVHALRETVLSQPDHRWLLINEGRGFSAGFDLTALLKAGEEKRFDEVEKWLRALQETVLTMSTVDSVAGLQGFALGGGLELAMGCRGIVAHPETQLGLPEVLVGLVPAGCGTSILRLRSQDDLRSLTNTFRHIVLGEKVPAHQGKDTLYLRKTDVLLINPDQLLFQAVRLPTQEVILPNWIPASPPLSGVLDETIHSLRSKGELGEYGVFIAQQVKHIFVRPATMEQALELEREVFLTLLGKPMTHLRIKQMLETGKPLKN
ncbi:MAG: 3-hydroxyacyl-CoA dehydrogenase family protein, partial [Candidatus Caldarchaeum sp.]